MNLTTLNFWSSAPASQVLWLQGVYHRPAPSLSLNRETDRQGQVYISIFFFCSFPIVARWSGIIWLGHWVCAKPNCKLNVDYKLIGPEMLWIIRTYAVRVMMGGLSLRSCMFVLWQGLPTESWLASNSDMPASANWVLVLKMCAITAWLNTCSLVGGIFEIARIKIWTKETIEIDQCVFISAYFCLLSAG